MADSAPSKNPANSGGDLPGGMREILRKFSMNTDDKLPAKIVAYDREKNRATIQPMIQMVGTDGELYSRNQLASIPVVNIGGGGFIMSFNLRSGDLGWIMAADRDIAIFLKDYTESEPGTKRIHDFNNGFFVPDVMTGYSIDAEDEENAVLQSLDGSVKISLGTDQVKVKATNVIIDGDTALGGPGGLAIARVGDVVSTPSGPGTITGGSSKHTAT